MSYMLHVCPGSKPTEEQDTRVLPIQKAQPGAVGARDPASRRQEVLLFIESEKGKKKSNE